MKIIAIRHTSVENPTGICYGQLDIPLAETFPNEADKVRENLSKISSAASFDFYSSPAQRCIKLAKHLSKLEKVQIESAICEMHFGNWQGRRWENIDRQETELWIKDMVAHAPPNGESFIQLIKRVEEFLTKLSKPSILITHAGVLHAIRVIKLGYSKEETIKKSVAYGEIIEA